MPTRKKASPEAEAKAAKLIDKMAITWAALSETQAPALIGSTVLELVSTAGDVSVDSILVALRAKVADAPSARGKGNPRLDVALLTAEAAIRQLQALRPSA